MEDPNSFILFFAFLSLLSEIGFIAPPPILVSGFLLIFSTAYFNKHVYDFLSLLSKIAITAYASVFLFRLLSLLSMASSYIQLAFGVLSLLIISTALLCIYKPYSRIRCQPFIFSSKKITPSVAPETFTYDVFVSFRGADTRNGIARELVKKLEEVGMDAFIDETGLKKGEKIDELLNVIKSSYMFILIISEHYGDSKWCIKEMMEILGTKRTFLPVFYKVDTHDVKHQRGRFGENFRKNKAAEKSGRTRDEVIRAFREVASRSGHVVDDSGVADRILKELKE